MGFNSNFKEVIFTLKEQKQEFDSSITHILNDATELAIEKATEITPPTPTDPPRGENTITGELKEGWSQDSVTIVIHDHGKYTTELNNNKEYASFINDGHFLDQHYVPGLVVNVSTGLLDKVDPSLGGIIVGTKTVYIPGLYMSERAIEVYQKEIETQLDTEIERIFKD